MYPPIIAAVVLAFVSAIIHALALPMSFIHSRCGRAFSASPLV
jgi:hypothetical protein